MNDDFAQIFQPPNIKPDQKPDDPFDSEEYQRFVESMVPHCHCADQYRPCDGVLAGGICDGQGLGPNPEDDAGWVDWEHDEV